MTEGPDQNLMTDQQMSLHQQCVNISLECYIKTLKYPDWLLYVIIHDVRTLLTGEGQCPGCCEAH